MKRLIFITLILLLLTTCSTGGLNLCSPYSGQHSRFTSIHTTIGQELLDLQKALDSGAITQEEYDELKLQIIERYDEPADSTAHEIMKMIFGSEDTPADSTNTN